MNYKQLLDLGFVRNDTLRDDKVYFDQHGFECFWLEYILYNNGVTMLIMWYPLNSKFVFLTYYKGTETGRREITSDEMMTLINVFNRQGDIK